MKIKETQIKHTLRLSRRDSQRLEKWAKAAGISKAEYMRQKLFGKEPQPMPSPPFWQYMQQLYEIHDQITDEKLRQQVQKLILEIQAEATQPREVIEHGSHQPLAH